MLSENSKVYLCLCLGCSCASLRQKAVVVIFVQLVSSLLYYGLEFDVEYLDFDMKGFNGAEVDLVSVMISLSLALSMGGSE